MCCPSPVAMQQRAEAQTGTVCARHRKMQSVIRGEGTALVSPAGRLKHHTHAYLIEPSPTVRREERCSQQMVFCRHASCSTACWQEPQVVLQPRHSPPLSCSSLPSRTTSTKQLSKACGSPTTAGRRSPAPFSCCLLPIGIFSGPPLSKGEEEKERIHKLWMLYSLSLLIKGTAMEMGSSCGSSALPISLLRLTPRFYTIDWFEKNMFITKAFI